MKAWPPPFTCTSPALRSSSVATKQFHMEQKVNRARNRKGITLSANNGDFKGEPITCSMSAFVRSLLKRTGRLPAGTPRARAAGLSSPGTGERCTRQGQGSVWESLGVQGQLLAWALAAERSRPPQGGAWGDRTPSLQGGQKKAHSRTR